MANKMLDNTQEFLLRLLDAALHGAVKSPVARITDGEISWNPADVDADRLIDLAKSHAVISFAADILLNDDTFSHMLSASQYELCRKSCESVILSGHRLLYLTDTCLKKLDEAGIVGVVLKGWGVAGYFDMPELRKVGDIDILVADTLVTQAVEAVKSVGFDEIEGQHSIHHTELIDSDKMVLEIHNMLVEPFEDETVNEKVRRIGREMLEHTEYFEYEGYRIRRAAPEYNAVSLILHMLQHYMRAGFGLKLLCDWVVFVDRGITNEQYDRFNSMAKELGIAEFVKMVNSVCHRYLGMKPLEGMELITSEKDLALFMSDIFEGEEFGRSDSKRMVVVNGSGLGAYVKEFHHQMKLNNPKLSRWWILWIFLWIKTLAVFLVNNRKIRKTSTLDILKSAGKRGRIVEKMKLFETGK